MSTINAVTFSTYLDQLQTQLNNTTLDQNTFDTTVMQRQIEALKAQTNNLDDNTEISLASVINHLNEAIETEIELQSAETFGVDPNDVDSIHDFNWKSRTASMVEKVDKLINNTSFLAKSLHTHWDNLSSSDFFADKSISDWTKEAANGKKQVETFRKEMVYNLQILDNAKNLSNMIGSNSDINQESPEQGAAIAEYALLAVKTAARASQLGVVAWQESLISSSFTDLSSTSAAINNKWLKENIENFLSEVWADPTTAQLARNTASFSGDDGNTIKYSDYASKLQNLQETLSKKIHKLTKEKTELITSLENEKQELLSNIAQKETEIRNARFEKIMEVREYDRKIDENKYLLERANEPSPFSTPSWSTSHWSGPSLPSFGPSYPSFFAGMMPPPIPQPTFRAPVIHTSSPMMLAGQIYQYEQKKTEAEQKYAALSIDAEASIIELREKIEDIDEQLDMYGGSEKDMTSSFHNSISTDTDTLSTDTLSTDTLSTDTLSTDTPLQKKAALIAQFESLKNRIDSSLEGFSKADKIAAGAETGYRLASIGASVSNIVKNALSGDGQTTTYVGESLSIVADLADVAGAFTKLSDATKAMNNFQAGAGAVSGVIGIAPQLSSFAQAIMDIENAPDAYKGHYIGEAIVQAANAVMAVSIGALTTHAAIAGTTISKAVPALGVVASLASAINPLQWAAFDQQTAHINDVKAKADATSEAYETSAAYLSELLEDLKNIDVGFYSATTVTGVIGGVGTTALAASGVGVAPALAVAGITAGLQATLELFKQTHLNNAAEKMADKIRAFEGGVVGFFDRSFDYSSERELQQFFDQAQSLINNGYDSVSALGSVQMTASDLELSALSGIGGELGKTQKHFSGFLEESQLGTQNWNREEITIDTGGGIIQRGNIHEQATGNNNILKFITPLAAAGNESTHREKVSKNRYETTITIDDLKGWTIKDGGDNTTFDLKNIVTKARAAKDGALKDVPISIEANAGDDMFLVSDSSGRSNASGSAGILDGGAGRDAATYANLQHLTEGLQIDVNHRGNLQVKKVIDGDVAIYQDTIGQYEVKRGKETEIVEYRYISSDKLGHSMTLFDELKNIEMLAGSEFNDSFNIADYNDAFLAAGLAGDDVFTLKQTQAAMGGQGDDIFHLVGDIDTRSTTALDLPETVEIVGGDNNDTIVLNKQWTQKAFELGALYFVAEEALEQNPELKNLLLPTSIESEQGEDIAVAMVANMLSKDNWASTSFLAFSEVENVEWDLQTMHDVLFDTALESSVDLVEYDKAARTFLNHSTIGDYDGLITYDFSDTVGGYTIKGTNNNDKIIGSQHADSIFGGDGDDVLNGGGGTNILTGADGADEFVFDFSKDFNDTVRLVDHSLAPGHHYYGDQALQDSFVFKLGDYDINSKQRLSSDGDDLRFGYGESRVTIENFYTEGYAGTTQLGDAEQTFVFESNSGTRTFNYDELSLFMG